MLLCAGPAAGADEPAAGIRIVKPAAGQKICFEDKVLFEAEIDSAIDRVIWRIWDKNNPRSAIVHEGLIETAGGRRVARQEHVFALFSQELTVIVKASGMQSGNAAVRSSAELELKVVFREITASILASDAPQPFMQPIQFRLQAPEETAVTWDFDDGTTSAERHPIHTYTRVGAYKVLARVEGKGGKSVTCQREVQVAGKPPQARVRVLYEGKPAQQVPLGARVELIDESIGDITDRAWLLDGDAIPYERRALAFNQPGWRSLVLRVTGPVDREGRAARSESAPQNIEVLKARSATRWLYAVGALVLAVAILLRARARR